MLVEEAQHFAQHRQFRLDPAAPRRDVDARAVVPRPQHDAALGVGQRQETRQRAVGVARAVHPAGDGIDRDILGHLVEIVVGAERGAAEGRIVRQRVVAEFELAHEVGHAEVREMPLHRVACQRAVLVVVDRHRPLQRGIGEVAELGPEIAAIVIERQHQLVVDQRQPLDQQAAGIIVVGPGVPHREQRRDRLHRLVAGAGEKIAGRAEIGDAGGADARRRSTAGRRSSRRSPCSRRARAGCGRNRACRSSRRCRAHRPRPPRSRAARTCRDTCSCWARARRCCRRRAGSDGRRA